MAQVEGRTSAALIAGRQVRRGRETDPTWAGCSLGTSGCAPILLPGWGTRQAAVPTPSSLESRAEPVQQARSGLCVRASDRPSPCEACRRPAGLSTPTDM